MVWNKMIQLNYAIYADLAGTCSRSAAAGVVQAFSEWHLCLILTFCCKGSLLPRTFFPMDKKRCVGTEQQAAVCGLLQYHYPIL